MDMKNFKPSAELLQAFDEIQQPRPPYVLEKFVVGAHHTEEQRYAQCVLEMQIKYDNLRLARLRCEKKELEIAKIRDTPVGRIDRQIKEIELEQLHRTMIGAEREFAFLHVMWENFPKKYIRAELDLAAPVEFARRLLTQAEHDLAASGRVSVGNQEGLRLAGLAVPQLLGRPAPAELDLVEQRYLAQGKCRMLIGVPTAKKAMGPNGQPCLPCIDRLAMPTGVEWKLLNLYSRPIAEAYTLLVREALDTDADYLLTVEDDTFPPADALVRLLELVRARGKVAAGAFYVKREEPRQGVHIIVGERERGPLIDDGEIHEVYTLAMGCSLYPVQMFREISEPWFKTTTQLSQDSYFSQKARDAGWTLLCDTSIKCKHIDRITGHVYE